MDAMSLESILFLGFVILLNIFRRGVILSIAMVCCAIWLMTTDYLDNWVYITATVLLVWGILSALNSEKLV